MSTMRVGSIFRVIQVSKTRDKAGYAKTIFDTALELSENGSAAKEKYYWCRQEILTGVEN